MIQDIPALIRTITNEIKQSMDTAVVGMSGGADSTLTAVLCALALGRQSVYSLHMPATAIDVATFNRVSLMTAEKLGIHAQVITVGAIADQINLACQLAVGGDKLSPVNLGNARARARMAVLYGVSHHLGETQARRARVVGTGNLSEDFIGYDTKGGDALADLFPIGELFKSEVYQLLNHFRDEGLISDDMIDRVPSAGLWPGQTDESELGYSYAAMEAPIRKFLKEQASSATPHPSAAPLDAVETFVRQRHAQHKHKHLAPTVIKLRHLCD